MTARLFLVEHYRPGCTRTGVVRASTAVSRHGARHGVRHVRTVVVLSDEAYFSLFEAGSLQAVESAYRAAGVECERITEALPVDLDLKEETCARPC
jgi:hypothetical protein